MFRKKKEADEGKKKFPFISLIAFILTILVFFFFASRVNAIDGEEEESSERWGYEERPTYRPPTPPPIEEPESYEAETSEPEETQPEETQPEETQPEEIEPEETEPEESSFVYSDLEYLRRDVSAIKSLLLFTLVGSSAVLLCYMLYRLIRNFM